MRSDWVVLGLGISVPAAVLSFYLWATTWTEVIGYTTYIHRFSPTLWVGAAFISAIGFVILVSGLFTNDRMPRRGELSGLRCPNCGAPRTSRFCQKCGARLD